METPKDPPAPETPPPAAAPAPTPPAAPHTPPPAASVVLTGERTEREVELETQLESERKTRKDREQRVNELEDENRRLKTVPAPVPASRPKRTWGTVLDDDD